MRVIVVIVIVVIVVVVVAVAARSVRDAAADPVVVAVDGADIYVDLGARDGVGAGAELELLHEVVAKDPRSGAVLRDRFALGRLSVVKSGDRLSVARADAELHQRVLAGDRVRLVSAPRRFVDPWAERVRVAGEPAGPTPPGQGAPATPAPGTPRPTPGQRELDHAALAGAAWQDTLGKSPEARIARWAQLLVADPRSPYRVAIEREIATLQAQLRARDAALAAAHGSNTGERAPRIAQLAAQLGAAIAAAGDPSSATRGHDDAPLIVAPIRRAVPGAPIELAFLVRSPARVARAWLYVRPSGQPGFRRTELVADGDAYLRATIDRALVDRGTLYWYVEAAALGDAAEPEAILGTAERPRAIEIASEVGERPIRQDRSHIDAHVDYVDFDGGLADGFDQYYQAEIDFTYRFLDPIYAVRLGSGTLSGIGGPKDVIDADPMQACRDASDVFRCKRVTFSYVYLELEHRLRPNVAVMIRPQAGLLTTDTAEATTRSRCSGDDLANCDFFTGLGGRLRLRLGDAAGTNLVIGAGFTANVGTLLEASYQWRPNRVVPIQLSVQVTDQPVPEDFGVRLIADVGWRELAWFYPSARLSYQARDIDHAGVSGGLAMNFDW